mgnify:CR=1 FL=1|tara:strand:- start:16046 stop:16285 length:240 start_codon:yes stop_codon:yes gene_type:complete
MGVHECEFCLREIIDYDKLQNLENKKRKIILRLNALKKLRKEGKLKSKDEMKQLQDQLVEITREDCGDPSSMAPGANAN